MRQVAKFVYIKELLDGQYEQKEGWDPNIMHTGRGDISRCNIIGTLIDVAGQRILDDGTGQISLRTFEPVKGMDIEAGKVVQLIGRPRQYNDETNLIPEVVREIDPLWAKVRKAQLGPITSFTHTEPVKEKVVEEAQVDNKAEKLVDICAELDSGDGVAIEDLISKAGVGEKAEKIVEQLLLDGEIFEIRPGIVKVL